MSSTLSIDFNIVLTYSIPAIDAQHFYPQPKDCHTLNHSMVRKTGICDLRKCHISDDYFTCHVFKGLTLCDCRKGYLFNQCTGQCVRPRHCPKVIGNSVVCNNKRF